MSDEPKQKSMYFAFLGKKGAASLHSKRSKEYFQEIGRKGGLRTKEIMEARRKAEESKS